MSKRVDFYSISLWNQHGITNYPVDAFFERISYQMFNGERHVQVVRKVKDKLIRIFPYYYSLNRHQIIIPFGKVKDKNKPYWLNGEGNLEEIPANLFDINSLGYDSDYNVMLLTTNNQGPSFLNIEEYLNTFIPDRTGLYVKIEPIMYNTGIEKVRNANLVRSVTFKLDLGCSLNDFYLREIVANRERTLRNAFRALVEAAKNDGDSRSLSLTLGLGKYTKKDGTLNLDNMLGLLESINLNEDFVTEIEVNYKDGTDEKLDQAKLKNSQMYLSYICKCKETQVSPESLLNNINDAVADRVIAITRYARQHYVNINEFEGAIFNVIETWNNHE